MHIYTTFPLFRCSGPSPTVADVYDISLTLPESVSAHQLSSASAPIPSEEIQQHNMKIQDILQEIHQLNAKREFMMTFVENPIETMEAVIAYQAQNLKVSQCRWMCRCTFIGSVRICRVDVMC